MPSNLTEANLAELDKGAVPARQERRLSNASAKSIEKAVAMMGGEAEDAGAAAEIDDAFGGLVSDEAGEGALPHADVCHVQSRRGCTTAASRMAHSATSCPSLATWSR